MLEHLLCDHAECKATSRAKLQVQPSDRNVHSNTKKSRTAREIDNKIDQSQGRILSLDSSWPETMADSLLYVKTWLKLRCMLQATVVQGVPETPSQKHLVAVREPVGQFSWKVDQMKEKHLQSIMFKRRPDRFRIGKRGVSKFHSFYSHSNWSKQKSWPNFVKHSL